MTIYGGGRAGAQFLCPLTWTPTSLQNMTNLASFLLISFHQAYFW